MEIYEIVLPTYFPAGHPRAGDPTYFEEEVTRYRDWPFCKIQIHKPAGKLDILIPKVHTVQKDYELWSRRFEKINRGEAKISLRIQDYGKTREIALLTRGDDIGLTKLFLPYVTRYTILNDGMTNEDWYPFFRGIGPDEPLAIIHLNGCRLPHAVDGSYDYEAEEERLKKSNEEYNLLSKKHLNNQNK